MRTGDPDLRGTLTVPGIASLCLAVSIGHLVHVAIAGRVACRVALRSQGRHIYIGDLRNIRHCTVE